MKIYRSISLSRRPILQYRYAFTLVELMVALTIAMVLTVVALPRVREGLQQNVASRSATLVKSAFENARSNAIRSGKPYGVILHRVRNEVTPGVDLDDPLLLASHGANYCKRISFAQVAFDYRGEFPSTTMRFDARTPSPPPLPPGPFFVADISSAGLLFAVANNLIPVDQRPFDDGSLIRLGKDGVPFVITHLVPYPTAAPTSVRVYIQDASPNYAGNSRFRDQQDVPFSIETRPIPSPLRPIELPGKVVVDLAASGPSRSPAGFSPMLINASTNTPPRPPVIRPDLAAGPGATIRGYRDIIVMFNALGQIDGVYLDQFLSAPDVYGYVKVPVTGQIALLVGEIDAVVHPQTIARYPAPRANTVPAVPVTFDHAGRKIPNFANTNSSWLSINPVSGHMVLKPVASPYGLAVEESVHPVLSGGNHNLTVLLQNRLLDSRRLTRGVTR
jgi:type II secretory pathway pseudopilin PulG